MTFSSFRKSQSCDFFACAPLLTSCFCSRFAHSHVCFMLCPAADLTRPGFPRALVLCTTRQGLQLRASEKGHMYAQFSYGDVDVDFTNARLRLNVACGRFAGTYYFDSKKARSVRCLCMCLLVSCVCACALRARVWVCACALHARRYVLVHICVSALVRGPLRFHWRNFWRCQIRFSSGNNEQTKRRKLH